MTLDKNLAATGAMLLATVLILWLLTSLLLGAFSANATADQMETRISQARDAGQPVHQTDFSDFEGAVVVTDPINDSLIVHVGNDICLVADATTTARC